MDLPIGWITVACETEINKFSEPKQLLHYQKLVSIIEADESKSNTKVNELLSRALSKNLQIEFERAGDDSLVVNYDQIVGRAWQDSCSDDTNRQLAADLILKSLDIHATDDGH